ncbi:RDD family protein [Variovorax brevis]|uniref:RDD family protein n=1 Tax=Variovorax brevis TaxID=3053503 RepID=UPI004037AE90
MVSALPDIPASGESVTPSASGDDDGASRLMAPGLWRRMACWLYEGMLLFAVVFVAGWLFSTLSQMRNAVDPRQHQLLQAFLFIVLGIYFAWFWSKGQTLAMKTWGIRVVDAHGRALSQGRALARYLLSWIWFLPPLAALAPFQVSGGESAVIVMGWVVVWALLSRFHPQRQFWHDAWAGTRLIRSKPMSRR